MKKQHQHGGKREAGPGKKLGPPFKPEDEKMRRRSIGMLEADWQKAQTLADRDGVSVDEIIRRLVRAAA